MESFLNRYRNITVLLLVIFAQLVLLAMQVKNDQDVRVIRVWAVSTVTPVARIVEWFRGGSIGFLRHYILLHDASEENRKLRDEVGRLRLENNFLSNELNTAERAKALQAFQAHIPSKMLAANVIGTGAGSNSKVVFVNRGSAEGVMRGMAVVTPDGIVGKVIAAYPTASEVLLVTDPEFAAGVVSQKNQVRGTLKGQGRPLCKVDYVPLEEKVDPGEWFYTSGDDRVFPRGFAVGVAKVVGNGQSFKDIQVEPSGLQHGLEDVLIILESVHQAIPDMPPVNQPVYIAPAPPALQAPPPGAASPANADGHPGTAGAQAAGTEADKLRSIYKSAGDAQNHTFGEGPPGSKPPDFTHLPTSPLPAAGQPSAGSGAGAGTQAPAGSPQRTQTPAGAAGPPAGAQGPAGSPPKPHTPAADSGLSGGGTAAGPNRPNGAAASRPGAPKSDRPAGTPPSQQPPGKKSGSPAGAAAPGGRSEPAPQTPPDKSGPPAKGPGGAPRE